MEDIVVVGFGGHAKSVVDCIERMGKYHIVGYTDYLKQTTEYAYLGTDEQLETIYNSGVRNAVIGVGYLGKDDLREKLYSHLKEIGFALPVIVDPSATVSNSAKIGEGSFVGKNAVINAEAQIGKMVILNTSSIVEHECIVGDFVHIAVAAVLCGQVKVGKAAFVGANATVIQCTDVREQQIVPAGVTIR